MPATEKPTVRKQSVVKNRHVSVLHRAWGYDTMSSASDRLSYERQCGTRNAPLGAVARP